MQRAGIAGSFDKVRSKVLTVTLLNVSECIPSVTTRQEKTTSAITPVCSIDGPRSSCYHRLRAAFPLVIRVRRLSRAPTAARSPPRLFPRLGPDLHLYRSYSGEHS